MNQIFEENDGDGDDDEKSDYMAWAKNNILYQLLPLQILQLL